MTNNNERTPKTVSVNEDIWNEFKGFCVMRGETLEEGIERVLSEDSRKYVKEKFKK